MRGEKKNIFMNTKCRELFCWCHLTAKINDIISKPAPLIIAMHSATGKMRTRDLPNNHMQVFYFMSAGSLLLHTLLKTPVILLGFTELQNTPDAD